MTGRDGHIARRLPHDLLVEVWRRHRASGSYRACRSRS
jgi:hypothetical protein